MAWRNFFTRLRKPSAGAEPRCGLISRATGATDRGKLREVNEDTIAWIAERDDSPGSVPPRSLAIVADGMGGAQSGAVASAMAVETIRDVYFAARGGPDRALSEAFRRANRAIYRQSRRDAEMAGMGTTCVAAAIVDGRIWAAWAGDARLYLFRAGASYQLTEDHTVVAELVRAGELTQEEAVVHESRHVLTRALGTHRRVAPGVWPEPMAARPGDFLLLCSDGAYGPLGDGELADLVTRPGAAAAIVEAANDRSGEDNASAVVIEFAAAEEPAGMMELARARRDEK